MFNRCKWCDTKCPDFSDICDGCARIEQECRDLEREIYGEDEEIEDEKF